MPLICSHCKHEIALPAIAVEFGTKDRAVYAGHSVAMSPREAEVTAVLINKQGEFADVIELMRGMYGATWIDYEPEGVPAIVSRARHRLRAVGLEIVTVNKRYALRLKDGCACARGEKPVKAKSKSKIEKVWNDERMRVLARHVLAGERPVDTARKMGVSADAVHSIIKRQRARFQELKADEARIAMGSR